MRKLFSILYLFIYTIQRWFDGVKPLADFKTRVEYNSSKYSRYGVIAKREIINV